MAAAIWYGDKSGQPATRSPIAYDHRLGSEYLV